MLERSRPEVERPPETFEDFYRREYTPVVGLAYALSGSRSGAEDLAQEAFFAAHRNWEKIAGYEQPGAWVRRVVANLSVSAFRRRAAEAKAMARAAFGQRTELPDLGSADPEFWRVVRGLPRAASFSSSAIRTSVMTSFPRSWNWRITSARTSLGDVRTRSRSRRAPGPISSRKRRADGHSIGLAGYWRVRLWAFAPAPYD